MQSEFCKNRVGESTFKGDYTDWCVSIISFRAVVMYYEIKKDKKAAWISFKSQLAGTGHYGRVLSDKQEYLQLKD